MTMIKNNLKYIIFSLISFISIFKYVPLYLKNNVLVYLIYVLLITLFFVFYKKLYDEVKIERKYEIFIIIMSVILVLGYSYEITSTGNLFWGSIENLFISLLKLSGYYYFFKVVIYYFINFMKKEYIYKNKLIILMN